MSYIIRREGRYTYRRRFSAEVAAIVGRAEFRKALGTADRAEAMKLARKVSVEFDRICDEALHSGAADGHAIVEAQPVPVRDAAAILSQLQAVVAQAQRSAIEAVQPAQRVSATWRDELAWRKDALRAIADGNHPGAQHYNPLEAMAALQALESLSRGEVPALPRDELEPVPKSSLDTQDAGDPLRRTQADFDSVLTDYGARVTARRARLVGQLCRHVLRWPATPSEQVQRILAYCSQKLAAGVKPSSLSTNSTALIAVLRLLDGWGDIKLPKTNATTRAVREGQGGSRTSRQPIPLNTLQRALAEMQKEAKPADTAAVVLLARYGLRPSELLREGLDALGEREDIVQNRELVFRAGLTGRKTEASRRDLPVHVDDVPLFRLVLSDFDLPSTATAAEKEAYCNRRVVRLRGAFNKRLPAGFTLYGIRHSVADLLRHCGATEEEVGGILGHTSSNRMTAIYGGTASLGRPRELLGKLRELLGERRSEGVVQPKSVATVRAGL
ncbi:DUF6538 domain-containing protein [Stutzerimonas nitrititolerans]|uniref:DUF6538 domain-containing protein n=1 Tax=Stutzerimonas nitrititolerans TaxID=2482751 RepID=UPI0028AA4F09|nr:DUF6538 domain-containing protein [Stutzerimonas nitrititolerans]